MGTRNLSQSEIIRGQKVHRRREFCDALTKSMVIVMAYCPRPYIGRMAGR